MLVFTDQFSLSLRNKAPKMTSDALNTARRKLNDALGDKATKYFNHMKMWFRMKLTKEEFDTEARSLLTVDQVHYHNEFLLALLNKVEGLAETSMSISQERASTQNRNSRRNKRTSRTASEKTNFEAADLLDYLPPNSPPGGGPDGVKYAVQEIFLPDHALVVGRFMLAAWELGLEGADDEAADLIVVAVQNFLKNVLTAVISQRKGYKCRGTFTYDLGCAVPCVWLRGAAAARTTRSAVQVGDGAEPLEPAVPRTQGELEQETAMEIACSAPNQEPNDDKLSIDEFYSTLQVNRNVIASHSVYAVNMERLAASLNHPSY